MSKEEMINELTNIFSGDEIDLLEFILEELSDEAIMEILNKVREYLYDWLFDRNWSSWIFKNK